MASGVQRLLSVTAGTGLLILGIAGGQAKAAQVNFNGSTPPDPGTQPWFRPNQNGGPSSISVAYSGQQFTVNTPGTYTFQSAASWDNFTILYQNSFDPNNPTAGFVIANDDLPPTTPGQYLSGFSSSLTPGTQYFFVTTGSDTPDQGAFSNTISGGPATGNPITLGPVFTPTPVPFEFSPGLGLSILGAWFGLSQLKTRMAKPKTIPGSPDQAS